jgi:hypothetical protein
VERKKREREKRRKRKEGFDVKHGIFVLRRRKCVIGFYEMVLGFFVFFLAVTPEFFVFNRKTEEENGWQRM